MADIRAMPLALQHLADYNNWVATGRTTRKLFMDTGGYLLFYHSPALSGDWQAWELKEGATWPIVESFDELRLWCKANCWATMCTSEYLSGECKPRKCRS